MAGLYRVWNGGRSPQDIEFCYVLAEDADEAARLGTVFLARIGRLPDPELMPAEPKAKLSANQPLKQRMKVLGRICTMSENAKKIPVIPEGFPPQDKAAELTPEQMRDLMDKHGYTTREIAEMYDDLPWQLVARRVAKLRNPEGKSKGLWGKNKPKEAEPEAPRAVTDAVVEPGTAGSSTTEEKPTAPPKPKKPTLLKPSSYQGELLQYLVSEKDIKFFSAEEELTVPKDKLARIVDELAELIKLVQPAI